MMMMINVRQTQAYFNLDKFINSVPTHTNHNKILENKVPMAFIYS